MPSRRPTGSLRTLVVLLALLSSLIADAAPASAYGPVANVPPSSIRVCRSSGGVDVVSFEYYVQQVLPREFPPTWPMEVLKAGAIAVKSYAWYYLEHPISDRCDIGDSTRYQKYDPDYPYNKPNDRSNAAVRETFTYRLEDPAGTSLYAQYCSGGCYSHKRNSGEGRYMNQDEARSLAEQGWTWEQLISYFYRSMDARLFDWRDPFALDPEPDAVTYGNGEPTIDVDVRVTALAPGEPQAMGVLWLLCTLDGVAGPHRLQDVGVTDVGGRATLDFAPTRAADGCEQDETALHVHLYVKGRLVRVAEIEAARPWVSAAPRDVDRVANTASPVAAGIQLSKALFDERAQEPAQGTGTSSAPSESPSDDPSGLNLDVSADPSDPASETPTEPAPEEPAVDESRQAAYVVVATSDVFADAMSATALAGDRAPILLHPGGPDTALDGDVAAEIDRVLGGSGVVHLVGGTNTLSTTMADALATRGYDVQRHSGRDRTATAVAVADAVVAAGGDASTVLVARAWPDDSIGWADAIAAGAYAAAAGHPILLTRTQQLPEATSDWIRSSGANEAVVLGGTASVSAATAAALPVDTVTRVSGKSRDATAVAIADELWGRQDAPEMTRSLLINIRADDAWPFGLAGAVLGARLGAPALAVRATVPHVTTGAWLDAHAGLPVTILGGAEIVPARIDQDAAGG